jgi:DNA-directed RNA polymerase specialized sigma24 family protein
VCRSAFDALDRNWTVFTRTPDAVAAAKRWSGQPDLVTSDLDALVRRTWQAAKPEADRICAALARLAPADDAAARVLLQILRPGLRNLGRRLALGGSFEDVDQELLAIAWERIRTYRVDRRPAAIAANILLDTRKQYVQAVLAPGSRMLPLEELPPGRWPASASAEHEAIDAHLPSLHRVHARLRSAVDSATITAASAAVVWRTRIQQEDDAEVASDLGVRLRTLQRRRQRAERQLAERQLAVRVEACS